MRPITWYLTEALSLAVLAACAWLLMIWILP
jgi:hypothetical protein